MSSPHPRAPLLWLVLPFGGGIALSSLVGAPRSSLPVVLALAAGMALLAAGCALGRTGPARTAWALLLCLAAMAAGFAHAHHRSPPLRGWDERPAREAEVEIRVLRVFASGGTGRMRYGLGRIITAPEHAAELRGLLVYFSTIRRADRVTPARNGVYRARGIVSAMPPRGAGAADGFEEHLRSLGVAARFQRGQVLEELHPPGPVVRLAAHAARRFAGLLRLGLEEHPSLASLQAAMLLGEKAALEPAQELAFLRSGTFHIFSVSGLHVGVIATAIQSVLLLLRAPRPLRVALGLAVLWFYVQVVGGNPPAVRAFIMVAFFLARGLWGLPGNPLAALAAAALTTLLLDPRQLFGSGFQLSYGVVAALLLMGLPLAQRWQAAWRPWVDLPEVSWRPWQKWWRAGGRKFLGSLAITIAAVVGSTPATIAAFGLFTPGALLANLVVVPLASLAIVAGFVSILAGLAGLIPAAVLFNHAAAVTIIVMGRLAEWSTFLPLAHFPAEYRAAWLAPLCTLLPLALMLAGSMLRWRPAAGGFWMPPAGVALALLACVRLG